LSVRGFGDARPTVMAMPEGLITDTRPLPGWQFSRLVMEM
jgi:hypothetical protein